MRTAFLTGGTGFVGGHVARALLDQGWRVRALVRGDLSRAPLLRGLPVDLVRGDLGSAHDLSRAIEGCDAIVHVAGLVKAKSLEEYREVNARGTQRLLRAAREGSPEALFLLVSSQAAAGPARNGRPVQEGDAPRPVSWYGISKGEGEAAVSREWRGPWIILRPGVVYGPGDRGLLALFVAASRGFLPVPAARSRIEVVYAEEAALAVALAAGRPELSGRIGFLCDPEPVTVEAFAAALARLRKPPARLVRVPGAMVRLLGLAESVRERMTGRSRPFNADKAREILAGDWLCDPAPVRRDLGLPAPISLEERLRSTWDWYVREGWLVL